MDSFIYFAALLTFLFLLSKALAQSVGSLVYAVTRSKKLAVSTLALLFLPGTIIHEFAHAAVAQGLGVYVGDIEFTPKYDGENVKLGSVQVASTDPFRQFLIGIAPLIIGFVLIFLVFAIYDRFQINGLWPRVLLFYILFQIGNTMFSSKRDMEGALELAIAIFVLLGLVYLISGKQVFVIILNILNDLEPVFKMASGSLVKIILIDLAIVAPSRFLTPAWRFSK